MHSGPRISVAASNTRSSKLVFLACVCWRLEAGRPGSRRGSCCCRQVWSPASAVTFTPCLSIHSLSASVSPGVKWRQGIAHPRAGKAQRPHLELEVMWSPAVGTAASDEGLGCHSPQLCLWLAWHQKRFSWACVAVIGWWLLWSQMM